MTASNLGDVNDDNSHVDEECSPRTMEVLEVDENHEEDDWQDDDQHEVQRTKSPVSSCLVLSRYFVASTSAVLLTYYCPETKNTSPIPLIVIYVLIWISLLVLHKSNPGYLEGHVVEQICNDDGLTLLGYEKEQETTEVTRRTNAAALPLPSFSLSLDEPAPLFRGTRRKLCHTCNFAPPLRSHHCRECNKCVATFDHHCYFIGTCIGECNHCRFWVFLTLQTIGFFMCSRMVASSSLGIWEGIVHQGISRELILVLIAKIYLYPLLAISAVLWILHTVFALSNKTTFECSKGPERIDYLQGTRFTDAPFSRGCLANVYQFCWQRNQTYWKPIVWQTPGKIVRDSDDVWEHPWENKYWTCC